MQVNELKHDWLLFKCEWNGNWEGISSRFFEYQPNDAVIWVKKRQKARSLSPRSSKIRVTN